MPTRALTVSGLSEDVQLWKIKRISQLALWGCVRVAALAYSCCARTFR